MIYAPFDGKVDVMFETGHAVGLVGENGVELLVHIGIDTVNLEGKYFSPKKAAGDVVKKGDVLIEFDIEKIKELQKLGYRLISTTLSENSKFLEEFSFDEKNIVVMGNEANGVSKEMLEISNEHLKIDMDNSMESLNVSIATAIIMYKIFKR